MADAEWKKTRYPGIYKRGGRYVIRYRAHGKQRTESAATIDEARRLKSRREAEVNSGEFHQDSRITFRAYALEWIDRYQGRGRRGFRENTREDYRRLLDQYALKFFPAQLRMAEVTPRHVAQFIGWLCDEKKQGQALADSTVKNALSPVKACFATAMAEGVVRHNPTAGVAMPNRPSIEDDEAEVRVLTRDQLRVFLDMVARLKPQHLLFFRFLAATGLRWSEIAGLQWKHLRLEDPVPHVRVRRALVKGQYGPPKSKYGRRDVPLPLSLVVELERWQRATEWPGADELVFHSASGTPLHHSNMRRRVLVPVAAEADVSWMGFKTLRHTCASLLFDSGRNAKQVQRFLGHHSPSFTLATYIHLLSDEVAAPLDLDAEIRPVVAPVEALA